MNAPFAWDHYSDQPSIIRDKALKRKMRRSALISLIKTFLIALLMIPLAIITIPFLKRRVIRGDEFFGIGVNLDKEPNATPALLQELGVKKVLVRIPLWDITRLDDYVSFIGTLKGYEITVALLQDREHITTAVMTRDHLNQIFDALEGICNTYLIGSTINRAKWGFFSVNEYLDFYAIAYSLKKEKYPHLRLIGSQVIDFEYHFSAHTLFNFKNIHYDAVGTLLYVDRRGAPENTQMGFNLIEKIRLLAALAQLSPKSDGELIITETNWPLSGTAPYAPTSETECVDEESYADFMVRYHLLAFVSQQVRTTYWHQLVAPGYGLIDNRDGIRKRSAFYAYQTLLAQMEGAEFIGYGVNKEGRHTLLCEKENRLLHIEWSTGEALEISLSQSVMITKRDGEMYESDTLHLGPSPIYYTTPMESE